MIRGLFVFVCAAVACSCGGNPVSSTPPPPVIDPPKISCPADVSQTSPTGLAVAVSFSDPTVALGKAPVSTVCTPASGTPFQLGTTTVQCVATDALQRTDSCRFTVTVAAPPRLSVTRFVAFGDSITWGEDGQNASTSSLSDRLRPRVQVPLGSTYPGVLQTLLSARYTTQSFTVVNAGCAGELAADDDSPCDPGRSTRHRFDYTIGASNYQVLLLMEGANDLSEQFSNNDPSYADRAITSLQSIIGDAQAAGIRVYLATLPPENPYASVPARRGQAYALVPAFNTRLASLAASQNAVLVDVYAAFNGDTTTLIGPDGLHPTVAGYAKIANTFFDRVRSTLELSVSSLPRVSASSPGRTGSSATRAAAGRGSAPAGRKPR